MVLRLSSVVCFPLMYTGRSIVCDSERRSWCRVLGKGGGRLRDTEMGMDRRKETGESLEFWLGGLGGVFECGVKV